MRPSNGSLNGGATATILRGGDAAVVFDLTSAAPRLAAWLSGIDDIAQIGDPAALVAAHDAPTPEAGLDQLAPATLLAEASLGFPGRPGIEGHRHNGTAWSPRMAAVEVATTAESIVADAVDEQAGLGQRVEVQFDSASVLMIRATVTNTGDTKYELNGVTLTVQLPGWCDEIMRLGGRWVNEFRPERVPFTAGAIEVENRAGRTSHDRFPVLFAGSANFSEEAGSIWAAHLAHSGNTRLRAEALSDGRRVLQAGELLLPGEIQLEPGDSYRSPWLYLAASDAGLNGISDSFHAHLRARDNHPTTARPVLLNTWEAVYFDHDLDTLVALADRAAEIGVERFVLDDGWFRHRRSDKAGLGDWYVDETVWPNGLHPIADHVVELGMEFGLWFEPEMVNPDSDLMRAHPDWVLAPVGQDPALARHQLVLDLVNPDAYGYLFGCIDAVLTDYPISYIKWDMNRNLVSPTHAGRATVHHQTHAVYRLIDELRAAYADVEIESCSSGGGRADFEILKRTERIWTSDCNDALDRHRIQRGFSYLLPPELMGAHIGPPRSHTTGRTHSLAFRAAMAFFGHLGIEWNVLTASADDRQALGHVIAEHKRLRGLLHTGRVVRFDHSDRAIVANGVIAHNRAEALVVAAQIETSAALAVAPIRITGLEPQRMYRVELLDLVDDRPGKAKQQPAWTDGGCELTGTQLGAGLQLPILNPESAVLVHITS